MKTNKLFFILLFLFLISLLFYPKKIYSVWYYYSNNPIISNGLSGSWNSRAVHSPMVLQDGLLYRMWYQGDNNIRAEIGYAFSLDGITWTPNNTFILGYLDTNLNYNAHNPFVIKNGNIYQMWFSGSDNRTTNIHINYTTSQDGINWNQQIYYNVLFPEYVWEKGNGISFPRVVLNNGVYHIWYGAHGLYNGVTRWKVGHASSTDGINWTKTDHPVLIADQGWENAPDSDVGNPYVIFENGTYHMYYHCNGSFAHATSLDGISWQKDPNPFYTNQYISNQYDSNGMLDPFILKTSTNNYLYYTGINQYNAWQIGLATSVPITPPPAVTSTPTPSITTTPTPTPKKRPTNTPTVFIPSLSPTTSPTPSLSLTPTPTPAVNTGDPVIFLPGMGGSWNPKEMFNCDLTRDEKWNLAPYASVYKRLLDTLEKKAGYERNKNLYIYGYDWRKNLNWQADKFHEYLNTVLSGKPDGTKSILIGHSMGGLVIRSYLTKYGSSKVSSVMTIASPHLGSTLAYPIWEKGEVENNDLTTKIALNQLISHCKRVFDSQGKTRSRMETIRRFSPSFKDMLPVFDYLKRSGNPVNYLDLNQKNSWMINNPLPPDLFGINFHTLVGKGESTIRFFNVINPSDREVRNGEWEDGKPLTFEKTTDGDGTVLLFSGRVENGINTEIYADHGGIAGNKEGINTILRFLGQTEITMDDFAPSKKALTVSVENTAEITVTDPKGNIYNSKEWIISVFDPAVGRYNIKINPLSSGNAYLRIAEDSVDQVSSENIFMINLNKNNPVSFYFNYFSGNISSLSVR